MTAAATNDNDPMFREDDALPEEMLNPGPVLSCECQTCMETNTMVLSIRTDLNQIMVLLGLIHGEITPTLSALQNSPIFKMLGVK